MEKETFKNSDEKKQAKKNWRKMGGGKKKTVGARKG